METIILLFLSVSALYLLIQNFGPGKRSFSSRDMEAFQKAARLREELKEVEKLVAPKTEPDHSVTLGIKSKKPDA